MICKKCGHENKDTNEICENCGMRLDNSKKEVKKTRIPKKETSMNRNSRKNLDPMDIGVGIGIILALVVLGIVISYFVGSKGKNEQSPNKEILTEDNKIAEDSYPKAIKLAQEEMENENYDKAAKLLSAIPEEAGSYYKQSQKELKNLEDILINNLRTLIDNKEYEKAHSLSEDYVKILPESESLARINKSVSKEVEKSDDKEQTDDTEKDDKNQSENKEDKEIVNELEKSKEAENKDYDLEELRKNNSYGMNGNPKYTDIYKESDFLNKNLTIDANAGQIRTEPNLNSGVAGSVKSGDKVYVEEVINDGGRYWLKIEGGWISSKLITGEFR